MTELTQKIAKRKFLKILGSTRSGGSISFASKAIGFSRQTIASWRRSDSNFDKAVSEATVLGKAILADEAEGALVDLVRKGNVTAVIYVLKCLRPEKWNDRYPRVKAPTGDRIEDRYSVSTEFLESLRRFHKNYKKEQPAGAG